MTDKTPSRAARWLPFVVISGIVFALDQVTKLLVIDRLALGQSWEPIPAVAAVFKITHSANSGAAFSIFQGNNAPLLIISLIMSGAIVIAWLRLDPRNRTELIVLPILFGGVIGNVADRVRLGTVIDFIHWQVPGLISNVSNIADHAIVFSILVLVVAGFFGNRDNAQHEPTTLPATPERDPDPGRVRDGDARP